MTEFELTIARISPILKSYGFEEVESYKNFVKLESSRVTVIIGYHEREKYVFSVGLKKREAHILHSRNLKDVFDYDQYPANYADFIIDFLRTKGVGILTGDVNKLDELEAYEHKQARIYTDSLLRRQNITIADNAWTKGDYALFVKTLDQIDKTELPNSYNLKYKMALNRIENLKK